jgi:hypothetical protein
LFVLFIYRVIVDYINNPKTLLRMEATYLNRLLVWTIHLSYIHRLCRQLRISSLRIDRNISIESCYELFLSRLFVDDVISSESLLWIDRNISIESSLYKLFIYRMFIEHIIKPKNFLRARWTILNRIFLVRCTHLSCVHRLCNHTYKPFLRIEQSIWIESCFGSYLH